MAWTAPLTAVDGLELTAAQYNTYIRDNMLEMAPAKATTVSQYFVSSGANSIAARQGKASVVTTSETTTSQTYTDLATKGPQVTVDHGKSVLVFLACRMENSASNQLSAVSYSAGGATHVSADNKFRLSFDGVPANQASRFSMVRMNGDLKPGTSTFTMKYRVGGSTGTFSDREIIVFPM